MATELDKLWRLHEQCEAWRSHNRRDFCIAYGSLLAATMSLWIAWLASVDWGGVVYTVFLLGGVAPVAFRIGMWHVRERRLYAAFDLLDISKCQPSAWSQAVGMSLYGYEAGILAAWECEQAHLPGDCPLCGAD